MAWDSNDYLGFELDLLIILTELEIDSDLISY